jgi:hypothetical protein
MSCGLSNSRLVLAHQSNKHQFGCRFGKFPWESPGKTGKDMGRVFSFYIVQTIQMHSFNKRLE